MQNLKYNGDISLDRIFSDNRQLIYGQILEAIDKSYLDPNLEITPIIKITINDDEYAINLTRDRFINSLEKVIKFYEETEEYEKCAKCVVIINHLTQNKMNRPI